MFKYSLFFITLALSLYVAPHSALAASMPSLDFVYNTEFQFESLIKNNEPVSPSGSVLGINSDDEKKIKVTTKLGKVHSSYFRDMTISPPKGWYISEDAMDWNITDTPADESVGLITEINNEALTAGISIARFDSEGVSLTEYMSEIEDVCELCGYTIIKKGKASVAGQKGRFIEVSNEDYRIKVYVFISEETVYFVKLTTSNDEWKSYQKILEKSVKTLKLR